MEFLDVPGRGATQAGFQALCVPRRESA
jgi:hypothetical protein